MFADLAPVLFDAGVDGLIPITPRHKKPCIAKWQEYSTRSVTLAEIEQWSRQYPGAGVGHVFGQDGLVAIDIDLLDPHKAAKAKSLAFDTLGHTDFIRIGLHPKCVLLYRLDEELPTTTSLGGVEIFGQSKQIVLHGIHPKTNKPYQWPLASLIDEPINAVPTTSRAAIEVFARDVQSLCNTNHNTATDRTGLSSGKHTTVILKAINADPLNDPRKIAAYVLSGAGEGDRHYTMIGAVMALARRGFSDAEIYNALAAPYSALFTGNDVDHRLSLLDQAIRWSMRQVGDHGANQIDLSRITADWYGAR